ncbi:polyamine ABC transporter ATP-binding protein [Jiella sonneratiae]|uniref:polyamine ABC transporter ATP-binding protein n=1 Tax=Jiella sonneratiae TaxID=2816856 RepID=UPI001A94A077
MTLEKLTKSYGSETVVRSISMDIAQGEFLSLLGPSGSGKTTTLSMIAGFVTADSGRILFGAKDVTRLPPRDRKLGMVFQNYAIFPHLDVFNNVAFPLTVRRLPKDEVEKRVRQAMEMVRLTGFETRYGKQLSGGQQQRVALARAIVAQPEIILMDEPLGALDKNLRYQMQMEIKEISSRLGMTVIYVTHDQEEALTMSDRIAIMENGRIAQLGAPRDVYEHPESVFVARFLGEANLVPVKRLDGILRGPGGNALRVEKDRSQLATGKIFVRPEKIRLSSAGEPVDGNFLPGKIRSVAFLGNVVRTEIAVDDEVDIVCDTANSDRLVMPKAGDLVQVSWLPSACHVLEG